MQTRSLLIALIAVMAALPILAADKPPGNDGKRPPDGPRPPLLAPDLRFGIEWTSKNLLPHPYSTFRFRRASGQVTADCRKLDILKGGQIVDCWLEHNARVRNVITWNFGAGVRRWSDWTAAQKSELRANFVNARIWRAGGFAAWPGPAFDDPPINREEPFLDPAVKTVLDPDAARNRYMAQIAINLAAEIDAWVPWSLLDYTDEVLAELLSSYPHQYGLDQNDGSGWDSVYPGGYVAGAYITHAHPVTVYRFLHSNGIIASTPRATIARLVEWSRDHMLHSFEFGPLSGLRFLEAFWHYRGTVPVARMIEGTVASDPELGVLYPGIWGWTTGCSGTTRFFRSVLRSVNIPVREVSTIEHTCTHFTPYFVGEGLYLSHGDDPYSSWSSTGDYTGDEFLMSSDLWHRWFPGTSDGIHCPNVGRTVIDLNIARPSRQAVSEHCRDLRAGTARLATSEVMTRGVGETYTVEQLDALGFWDRLDALALTSDDFYCVAWREGR